MQERKEESKEERGSKERRKVRGEGRKEEDA
jgi:hypothetical protein